VRSARRREERLPLRSALASLGSWHDCHEWHRRLRIRTERPRHLVDDSGRFFRYEAMAPASVLVSAAWPRHGITGARVRPSGRTPVLIAVTIPCLVQLRTPVRREIGRHEDARTRHGEAHFAAAEVGRHFRPSQEIAGSVAVAASAEPDVSKRRRRALLTFARESFSLMPYSPGGRGR
jgi:hypothetical protein